jgi:hypothetical protein
MCIDVPINRQHPIFDDFLKDTRKVRWIGSPALVLPENPDRDVCVLASYPEEEMSENESTRMYVWKYTGGYLGMIKGLIKGLKHTDEQWFYKSKLAGSYTHAEDWTRTDEVLESKFANKAAMTAEIYPNENKGRIVLSGPHVERNVWWGGHYEEVEDHDHNNLFEGFYHWKNITKNPLEKEYTYNYCLNRRCILWAAKVPDNALPPVYGPSQVLDFDSDMTNLNFTVIGSAECSDGINELNLYYRHSTDNENWTEWALFETDTDESDRWSWEFNSPNGSGHYEFYSIRTVEFDDKTEVEKVPIAADSSVKVIQ